MSLPKISVRRIALFAAIGLATLLAYYPALKAGFIWNDADYVTKPALRSLRGLWRIWFDVGATQQYYPLLHSAFWLEHLLWGDAPFGYHLVNVLLHATSACLLIRLLQKLTEARKVERTVPRTLTTPSELRTESVLGAVRPSTSSGCSHSTSSAHADAWIILAGFLFALHPIYVESVAWVSEQKNTLSTVFYLSALLTYLKYRKFLQGDREDREDLRTCSPVREHRDPRRIPLLPERATIHSPPSSPSSRSSCKKWYWISFLFFVFAILTKTVAATLPGAILVILWWQQGRLSWKRDVVPMIPWFVVGAAGGLFTAWVEKTYIGAEGADFALSFFQRAIVAGHGVWFYLGKLIWPADLIFIYPRWVVNAGSIRQWLYPIGVVVLVALLWLYRKRSRAPLAVLLFFLGSLFPVCGFFNLYAFIYSYVADHWQYLPSMGIMVFAAAVWGRISARPSVFRLPIFAFPILVLLVSGVLTFRQSGMYSDMETFYRRTIQKNPDCWMAENNLGDLLEREGRLDESAAHYERALAIKPAAKSYYNLGTVRREQHRMEEAVYNFREALKLAPNYVDARNNLGGVLGDLGRTDEAMAQLEMALRLDPRSPAVHSNLGIALARSGKYDEAIDQFRETLRLDPGEAAVYSNLGAVLRRAGRYSEAIAALRAAIRLQPSLPSAHVNLGIALAMEDKLDDAVAEFRDAIRADPNYAEAHNDLGNALRHEGRIEEARAEFTEALRLNPDFTDAQVNLGQLPP